MPVAKVQLPDGRVASLEIAEGMGEEDLVNSVNLMYQRGDFNLTLPEAPEEPGFLDTLGTAIPRGGLNFLQGANALAANLGILDDETFANNAAALANKMQKFQYSDDVNLQIEEIMDSWEEMEGFGKGSKDFFKSIYENPLGITAITGEQALPGAVGGIQRKATVFGLGKLGFNFPKHAEKIMGDLAAGYGGAAVQEQSGVLFEGLASYGVNINDPEEIQKFMAENPKIIAELRRKANLGYGAVGAFDTMAWYYTGMPFRSFTKNGVNKKNVILGGIAESGVQAGFGISGEASSQILREGRIYDPTSVALEGLIEGIYGVPQLAYDSVFFRGTDNPLLDKNLKGLTDPELIEKFRKEYEQVIRTDPNWWESDEYQKTVRSQFNRPKKLQEFIESKLDITRPPPTEPPTGGPTGPTGGPTGPTGGPSPTDAQQRWDQKKQEFRETAQDITQLVEMPTEQVGALQPIVNLFNYAKARTKHLNRRLGTTKVLDENGRYQLVFRGSPVPGVTYGDGKPKLDPKGEFLWFSSEPKKASVYGKTIISGYERLASNPTVMPAFLRINNPWNVTYGDKELVTPDEIYQDIVRSAVENGKLEDVRKINKEQEKARNAFFEQYQGQAEQWTHLYWHDRRRDRDKDNVPHPSVIKKQKALKRLLKSFGLDGIKHTEDRVTTYSVLSKNQILSPFDRSLLKKDIEIEESDQGVLFPTDRPEQQRVRPITPERLEDKMESLNEMQKYKDSLLNELEKAEQVGDEALQDEIDEQLEAANDSLRRIQNEIEAAQVIEEPVEEVVEEVEETVTKEFEITEEQINKVEELRNEILNRTTKRLNKRQKKLFDTITDAILRKDHNEIFIDELILINPKAVLGENMRIRKYQRTVADRILDFEMVDENGNLVIVEDMQNGRRKVDYERHLDDLLKYRWVLANEYDIDPTDIRMILVSHTKPKTAMSKVLKEKLGYSEIERITIPRKKIFEIGQNVHPNFINSQRILLAEDKDYRREWSDRDDAKLIELLKAETTNTEISKELNISIRRVVERIKYLEEKTGEVLKSRPVGEYTEIEDQIIIKMRKENREIKEIAKELGGKRSVKSIAGRIARLKKKGLVSNKPPVWTSEMDQQLIDFRNEGLSTDEIVEKMNVNKNTVKGKISTLRKEGKITDYQSYVWTKELDDKLIAYVMEDGLSDAEIAVKMSRSAPSIGYRWKRLKKERNLEIDRSKIWSDEKTKKLAELREQNLSYKEIAKELNSLFEDGHTVTAKSAETRMSLIRKGKIDLQKSQTPYNVRAFLPKRSGADFVGDAQQEGLGFGGPEAGRVVYNDTIDKLQNGEELSPVASPLAVKARQMAIEDFSEAQRQVAELSNVFETKFGERLKAVEMTPEMEVNLKPVIEKLKAIVSRVAGPNANLELFDQLFYMKDTNSEPIAIEGAQALNLIMTAISGKNPTENVYHELWHLLERVGVITEQDIKTIDKELPQWVKYLQEEDQMDSADLNSFDSKEGRAELRAVVFGKIAAQWDQDGKITRGLVKSRPTNNILIKAYRALKDMFSEILGMKNPPSLEDIFIDAFEGRRVVDDLVYRDKMLRLQRAASHVQATHQNFLWNMEDRTNEFIEARNEYNEKIQEAGFLGTAALKLGTKMGLAYDNKFMQKAFGVAQSLSERTHEYLYKFQNAFQPYHDMPKHVRHGLMEIALHNKINGQQARQAAPGAPLIYRRGNKTIQISNPKIADAYMAMQAAFKDALTDQVVTFKNEFRKVFPELPDNWATMGYLDSLKALEALETEYGRKPEMMTKINNMKASLATINQAFKTDYTPEMRFGKYGIAVYERPKPGAKKKKGENRGKLVGFYKIEEGPEFRKGKRSKYHPDQYEAAIKDIKRRFGDLNKYVIYGQNDAEQTDLNNIKPFLSSRDREANLIDPNVITIDMLASIMDDRYLDVDKLRKYQQDLISDVALKGFTKRFAQAKHVVGYSTDWDRVMRSYVHGLSHSLSHLEHKPMFNSLRIAAEGLEDEGFKKFLIGKNGYLDYITDPAEDQQQLRLVNFMWTMGVNPSTAALQYVTLPTITLGNMNMYDANIARNMGLISKWGSYASLFWKHGAIDTKNGLKIDLENEAAWDAIRKRNKKLSDEQFNQLKELAIRQYRRGNIGAVLTEESIGPSLSGESSWQERTRIKANRVAQMSGWMIAFAEQNTRFATLLATAEQLITNPKAVERAERVYENDGVFQESKLRDANLPIEDLIATHTVHRSHAIFGKTSRPEVFRSFGGSVFFPFMTWPHHMWGRMAEQFGSMGPEGKVGLATSLLGMMVLGGLIGLPGFELLKELYEAVYAKLGPEEKDLINQIHTAANDRFLGESLTHGFSRSLGGLDVAGRIGFPVMGQNIFMALLGMKTDPGAILGVQGSMLDGIGRFWHSYSTDAGAMTMATDLLPVSLANIAKSIDYTQKGVLTRQGRTQLLTADQIEPFDIVTRALGMTSAHIAREREKHFFKEVLSRQHKGKYNKFKDKLTNQYTRLYKAKADGDEAGVMKHFRDINKTDDEFRQWAFDVGYNPPFLEMHRNIQERVYFRTYPGVNYKKYGKQYRPEIMEMEMRINNWQKDARWKD